MKRTNVWEEVRKMRFEEAYEGWNRGRLSQEEAARLLETRARSFRRYLARHEAVAKTLSCYNVPIVGHIPQPMSDRHA